MEEKEKIEEVVKQFCSIINETKLKENQLVLVLANFLFSIGASLEECSPEGSLDVLTRYASTPTFGNALMAQAMFMKETWITERKKDGQNI